MAASCTFDLMEYKDENSIDPNLICAICHKPLKEPVCTPCDHTFGRVCITHWLTQSIHYSCPMCNKQPLLVKDLTQASRPLRNMLDQIRVRCTLCEQTDLQRGNFDDHIKIICPKAIVECQAADIRCPWKGPRDELQNHVSTCIFEPLRPVLASLIAENRKLIDQVQKHDNEIEKLTQKMAQMSNTPGHDSDSESDTSSVAGSTADGNDQKQENAIFIRNLPATITFHELFGVFSKTGRIKYNVGKKQAEVFIFKNPNKKDGLCHAKIVYVDKESAAAAIAQYNDKHYPQWNTRLLITISETKRKNFTGFGKANNEGNAGAASVDCEKATNKGQTNYSRNDQPQLSTEQNPTPMAQMTRRRPRKSQQDN